MTQTTFCRRRNMMEMCLEGGRLTSDPRVTICIPCRLCCFQGTIVPQWRNWLNAVSTEHAACEVTELLNACPLTRLVTFAEECIAYTSRSPWEIAKIVEYRGHLAVYSHGIRMPGSGRSFAKRLQRSDATAHTNQVQLRLNPTDACNNECYSGTYTQPRRMHSCLTPHIRHVLVVGRP
jgi:hypothetical protein